MANPVIDWEEALQQCGDDEEFLRELLADLRSETETQLSNIAGVIQNPQDAPFHRIMRAAHVIKGAAANLMCNQLRMAAMNLEQSSSAAHDQGPHLQPAARALVEQRVNELNVAAQQFAAFLQSIGV